MAPLLNELLQEAVDRCDTLSVQAQAAAHAATEVADEAIALADLAEAEALHLHDAVGHVIAALHDAATRTSAAVDHAIGSLDGVPGRTAETAAHVRALFNSLRDEILELDEAREHLLQGLQESGQVLDHDQAELGQHLQGYLTAIGEAWKPTVVSAMAIPKAGWERRTHNEDRTALIHREVDALASTAIEQSQQFATGLDHGARTLGENVTTTLGDAIQRHNELMADLRSGTLDETAAGIPDPSWIDTVFNVVGSVVKALQPLPNTFEEALFPLESGITTAAQHATEHLDAAGQSLAKANSATSA